MWMGKRDEQLVTEALYALAGAREALAGGERDAALDALDEAEQVLVSAEHTPGVSVAAAAGRLGVSEPTIRTWARRGALRAVPGARPVQIEPESLHRAGRALEELRERGQDRDWLQALVDLLHDREAREGDALREGLSQLGAAGSNRPDALRDPVDAAGGHGATGDARPREARLRGGAGCAGR